MSRRRARKSGGSDQKKYRERKRNEERQRKTKGKPSGELAQSPKVERILLKMKQGRPESSIVKLKQVSKGWVPRLTAIVFAKLKKLENASFGDYGFTIVRDMSTNEKIVFEVTHGFGFASKGGKNLGTFKIDFEKMTIERVKQRYY